MTRTERLEALERRRQRERDTYGTPAAGAPVHYHRLPSGGLAAFRNGRPFALVVGDSVIAAELVADYRQAFDKIAHWPAELRVALDEFAALSTQGTTIAPTSAQEGTTK